MPFIVDPANWWAQFQIPSCGQLRKQQYRPTLTFQTAPNKIATEGRTGRGTFTWGYPAGGLNNYVEVAVTATALDAPAPPSNLLIK